MKRSYVRLALATAWSVAAVATAHADESGYCHYQAPHCCDHTGWCMTQCSQAGPQGQYIWKWMARPYCQGQDQQQ